jgi:dTDP-glucose pyrophosphorylase
LADGDTEAMTIRRAVILAGGKGTRLRPYAAVLPKPLVPVADRPILELVIRQLARPGFTHIAPVPRDRRGADRAGGTVLQEALDRD